MATYQYVNKAGELKTIDAADSAAAMRAPDIAGNSGVSLITPPKAAVAPPKTTTTAKDRKDAFATTPVSSTPMSSNGPVTTTQLYQATSLPDASKLAASQPKNDLSSKISAVAGSTLSATGKSIDALLAQQQAESAAEQAVAERNRDKVAGKIEDRVNSTAAQDALEAVNKKFNVDKTIAQLRDIQQKMVGAQEALEMGLIYEGSRGVRMGLLSGRQASLQKQGLAVIGALQGTAQVLQGNIDLARSYAATTIDAINADNTNAMNALNTLLTLYNNDLIDLKKDERDIISRRILALEDQNKILEANKQDVADLMVKFPTAFLDGGVTLLDTKEEALNKMLPKMSAMEMQKFNLEMAALSRRNAGTSDADGTASDKQLLLQLKSPQYTIQPGDDIPAIARARGISADQIRRLNPGVNEQALQPGQIITLPGMTYEEALGAFSDTVSDSWIQSIYREGNEPTSPEDVLKNQYYGSFLNPDGTPREGVSITLDKSGRPVPSMEGAGGDKAWWDLKGRAVDAISSFFK